MDGENQEVGIGDQVTGDGETGGQGDGETGNPPLTPDSQPELARLRMELEEARARGLESHRRALLAENAGRVVPELVAGATAEELEASVARARTAFEAAKAAALAELAASQQVAAGNGARGVSSVEGMSPMEKIAYGLKRE